MSRRWTCLFVGLLLVAPPLLGQESEQPESDPPSEAEATSAEGASPEDPSAGEERGASAEDLQMIEDLLAEDDAVVEGGVAYDSEDRRDPFRSLLVTVGAVRREGPRPEGIAGLVIGELTVTGVWVTQAGSVAQVRSADDPVSYLLREGDQLFDGDVIRISYTRNQGAEVEFKQIVDDPSAPKPFREIVKRVAP